MAKYILLSLLLSTASVHGKSTFLPGFIEIRKGHKIYTEHYPAARGRPTLFVANGLTFSTKDYVNFAAALRKLDPGVGIVLYDMTGMGQTLLVDPPVKTGISIEDQVRDLRDLKRAMKITGPASLAGLSYGGALTLKYSTIHPDDFDHYIAMAPMLERLPEQDSWIRNMARWHIMSASVFPLNFEYYISTLRQNSVQNMVSWLGESLESKNLPDPSDFEAVYDFYLRILIYTTYWIPEPGVLDNPFKLEGVYRMVQGVKGWNAMDAAKNYPVGKIHALAGRQDEHVKFARMEAFWSSVPERARGSFLKLDSSRHKISTEWPMVTAAWILNILNNHPDLNRGLAFDGDPIRGEAVNGAITIPLKSSNKAGLCESLLRTVP